jgi:hypothetical protein
MKAESRKKSCVVVDHSYRTSGYLCETTALFMWNKWHYLQHHFTEQALSLCST